MPRLSLTPDLDELSARLSWATERHSRSVELPAPLARRLLARLEQVEADRYVRDRDR